MKYILEMANNHMGSVEHGREIIRSFAETVDFSAGDHFIKFQYRDLDNYIDASVKGNLDIHFVKRFESTRLSKSQFSELFDTAKEFGFKTACTPFDAPSAVRVIEERYDLIKIASACIDDWDIHEAIADTLAYQQDYSPLIVFSTGGATLEQIDRLASFYTHRTSCHFCILHCVAKYPYAANESNLGFIDTLKKRYPFAEIGYSAHELPDETDIGALAVMAGATVLEKHVGVDTDTIKNNQYSILPKEFAVWQSHIVKALKARGDGQFVRTQAELDTIHSLKRGAVVSKDIAAGSMISKDDVAYTFPREPGQLGPESFGIFTAGFVAKQDICRGERIFDTAVEKMPNSQLDTNQKVAEFVHKAKGLLRAAGIHYDIALDDVEISHHEGLANLPETGALLVTRINTERYSKKLVIQTPGQSHPVHLHPQKDETFEVLYGEATMFVEGQGEIHMVAGDIVRVPPKTRHSFRTKEGVVFEEVATAAIPNDSLYDIDLDSSRKSRLRDYWKKF